MAEQAITSPLVLALLSEEAPVDGNPPRIPNDGLDHTPQQHEEEYMEDDQQDDPWSRSKSQQELHHEYEVVEGYEHEHATEMRGQELGAAHLPVAHRLLFEYFVYYILFFTLPHPLPISMPVTHNRARFD